MPRCGKAREASCLASPSNRRAMPTLFRDRVALFLKGFLNLRQVRLHRVIGEGDDLRLRVRLNGLHAGELADCLLHRRDAVLARNIRRLHRDHFHYEVPPSVLPLRAPPLRYAAPIYPRAALAASRYRY